MVFLLFAQAAEAAGLPFTDVKENAWYYQDVKNAYEKKLIDGKTKTLYAPDDNMTYAEAVKLAACMDQLKKKGKIDFSDILVHKNAKWYQVYLDYAADNGLINREYAWDSKATRAGYMEIFAEVLTSAESNKNNNADGLVMTAIFDENSADNEQNFQKLMYCENENEFDIRFSYNGKLLNGQEYRQNSLNIIDVPAKGKSFGYLIFGKEELEENNMEVPKSASFSLLLRKLPEDENSNVEDFFETDSIKVEFKNDWRTYE